MFRDGQIAVARSSPLGLAVVTGRGKFRPAKHLALLNEALVRSVFTGRRRLMVFMPPRHGKSTLISRAMNAWYLGTFPDRQVGVASYEADFAKGWGRAVRSDMTEWGEEIFGLRVAGDSSASDRWGLAGHGGGMRTAGIEGRWTGLGFHLLAVDDPIKDAKQAHSKAYRDSCWDWFQSVAESRLEPEASVIVVMTRWHEDDLAGRALERQQGEWDVLSLPALAESEDDPMGRERGEALWPERYPAPALLARKQRVGSYWWAAQYQQRPSPEEGNRVRRDWWKFWSAMPRGIERVVTSTDCAFKDTDDSSFVVIQAWGQRGGDAFLLDQIRQRMDFPETLRAFEGFHRKWKGAAAKLVEDKANGPAVIASLKRKIPGILPVEVSGKGSKVARLSAVSPFIESGNVFLPDPAVFTWVEDYIEELATFPNGAHDDQVDATSQALSHLFGHPAISLGGGPERPRKPKGESQSEEPDGGLGSGSVERIRLW